MEEPERSAGSPVPASETPELHDDLAGLLHLLTKQDSVPEDTFDAVVARFIDTYEPKKNDPLWISQHSGTIGSSNLVSLLVDNWERLEPKQSLRLLLICASLSTLHEIIAYYHTICSLD